MSHQPDRFDNPRPSIEQIEEEVRIWSAMRHQEIVRAAFSMMIAPSGTRFEVAPLTFVGFANDDARAGYYLAIIEQFKRTHKGKIDERRLALFHVERLAAWLNAEMTRQLTTIAQGTAETAKPYYETTTV